ncbi:DUF3089 family protein [Rhodothalassium salexigens DSM 2132]|uniref:DUF3089 family protein n=1 Tax=Rhodothalassium salexigens DSM 2132 TaxID=1188247 RepID=A0A4R2PH73_RHOSA|nr:DUF3089 domain-containing protein [Rhodothalassium salexigens]MBB4211718.1 hypothetical protein [Rhodothalassium salexigens DSM 2132]MBK1639179.1 hypothetical protein [Rhodothalassium salexigens DSM 2132]TCP33984.1 DUF3089 family protein [Rhodothalassium salexigens DSM 2132]
MAQGRAVRIFLWIVVAVVVLIVALAILAAAFQKQLEQFALRQTVPDVAFDAAPKPAAPDYGDDASWAALPGRPGFAAMVPAGTSKAPPLDVDIFFVHPTTYLKSARWNAPIDEPDAARVLDSAVLKNQASAFAQAGAIYAPRYRQAAFGAFFAGPERGDEAARALDLAYGDVERAFAAFLDRRAANRPFVLAGHSQGSRHLLHLLADHVAGTALADRLVAAYVVGWPVAVDSDPAALPGIDVCRTATDTGCLISWQSFADRPDEAEGFHRAFLARTAERPTLAGPPRGDEAMLCTNPLSWTTDTETVPATANRGGVRWVIGSAPLGEPIPNLTGARCTPEGILALTEPPGGDFATYLLPGQNYHVYDIALFYETVAANVRARAEAALAAMGGAPDPATETDAPAAEPGDEPGRPDQDETDQGGIDRDEPGQNQPGQTGPRL